MSISANKARACAAAWCLLASVSQLSHAAPQPPKPVNGSTVYTYVEDQIVLTNRNASFTAVADASLNTKKPQSLTFQWQKNSNNIPGAIYPTLVISNVQVADVGFYSVVIANTLKAHSSRPVGSIDTSIPGARLFVLTGTNTAVSGAIQPGDSTRSCVGAYHGWVTFKNSSGSTWWTPATGSTTCTITDMSNYNPPYSAVVQAVDNITLNIWCATNQVTFPVTSGHKYQFTTFIKNRMPPPNSGDPLTLDINWQ